MIMVTPMGALTNGNAQVKVLLGLHFGAKIAYLFNLSTLCYIGIATLSHPITTLSA